MLLGNRFYVIGKESGNLSAPGGVTGNYSFDTSNYLQRLTADGETISEEDLALLEFFVQRGFAGGWRNQSNPGSSIVQEFNFYGGTTLNSALHKFWYRSGTPAKCINVGFLPSDFSRTTGLNPGAQVSKHLDTGTLENVFVGNNIHLSFWSNSAMQASSYEHEMGSDSIKLSIVNDFYPVSGFFESAGTKLTAVPNSFYGLFLGARSESGIYISKSGTVYGSAVANTVPSSLQSSSFLVFRSPALTGSKIGFQYSIGLYMPPEMAADFYDACLDLQLGLGRTLAS